MGGELSDEDYNARFKAYFGIELLVDQRRSAITWSAKSG